MASEVQTVRLSSEILDEERRREHELLDLSREWLRHIARDASVDLGSYTEFIASTVASIPELVNAVRISQHDCDSFAQNPKDVILREELIRSLRWQLAEALLRTISLDEGGGITWITVLDVLDHDALMREKMSTMEVADHHAEDALQNLQVKMKDLETSASSLETLVRGPPDLDLLRPKLFLYYIRMLETLAAAETAIAAI